MPRQYTPRVECQCLRCGESFTVQFNRAQAGRGKYCSRTCQYPAASGLLDRPCEQCGKIFRPDLYRTKIAGWGRFCSRACATIASRHERVERACPMCGTAFYVLATDDQVCCSRECFMKRLAELHWRGGFRMSAGYRELFIPSHPNASTSGYVREHRYVMSEHIGRPIAPNEHVHHINGNKVDNRIENLQLMTASEHQRLHHGTHGRWARSFDTCVQCGHSSSPHKARGMCNRCYPRTKRSHDTNLPS